jgi:hypothetical protein
MSRSKKDNTKSFQHQVAKAKAFLLDAQKALPIDGDPIPLAEGRSLRTVAIIPVEALQAMAEILATHGAMFPTFKASDASDAHAYEVAMRDLSATAKAFARRIDRSVLRRRVGPIRSALALYAAVKAIGRVDEQLDETTRRLAKLVVVGRGRGGKRGKAATQPDPVATPPAVAPPPAVHEVAVSAGNGVNAPNGASAVAH